MYNAGLRGLAVIAAIALGLPAAAGEPDGRVIFRYTWVDDKDATPGVLRLRLTVTAVVNLEETRLTANLPAGIAVNMRAAGREQGPWPDEGLGLGGLAAGETKVFDLDVAKPEARGGIVRFVVSASWAGRAFYEGVGVPVGQPGVEPVRREGVVEFPAERADPAP